MTFYREHVLYRLSEERLTDRSDFAQIPLHFLFSTAEALDHLYMGHTWENMGHIWDTRGCYLFSTAEALDDLLELIRHRRCTIIKERCIIMIIDVCVCVCVCVYVHI